VPCDGALDISAPFFELSSFKMHSLAGRLEGAAGSEHNNSVDWAEDELESTSLRTLGSATLGRCFYSFQGCSHCLEYGVDLSLLMGVGNPMMEQLQRQKVEALAEHGSVE